MSEYDNIKKQTDQFKGLHQRVHETFQRRSESPEAWAEWEQACRDFYNYQSPMRFIESPDGRRKLREGDPDLLEHAISFLELDPYVFRSGYAKAAIIRCIKNLPFTPAQIQRLQGVVLRALDTCDRPEFRGYRRLAAAVDSPEFGSRIRERLESPDAAVRRRARYVLDYLDDWRQTNSVAEPMAQGEGRAGCGSIDEGCLQTGKLLKQLVRLIGRGFTWMNPGVN